MAVRDQSRVRGRGFLQESHSVHRTVTSIVDLTKYGHESHQAIEFRNSQLKHQRKALFLGDSTRYKAAMDDIQRSQER